MVGDVTRTDYFLGRMNPYGVAALQGEAHQGTQSERLKVASARIHRGTGGARLVMRSGDPEVELPWTLLSFHSARLDVGAKDLQLDEALGLICAWFADVLVPLVKD